MASSRTYFAKYIYPDECGSRKAISSHSQQLVNGASGNCRIYIYLYDAVSSGTALDNSDTTVTLNRHRQNRWRPAARSSPAPIRIEIWIYRSSSADIDVYAIWGGPGKPTRLAWPRTRAIVAEVIAARQRNQH